jgi:hypothetical protein
MKGGKKGKNFRRCLREGVKKEVRPLKGKHRLRLKLGEEGPMKKGIYLFVAGMAWLSFLMLSVPGAAEAVTLEVLNPRGEIKPPPTFAPTPRVADLAGKRIGIYWNGKSGGKNFWDVTEELLKEKFPTATILRYRGPFDLGEKVAGTLAKEVDVFIYGVGD